MTIAAMAQRLNPFIVKLRPVAELRPAVEFRPVLKLLVELRSDFKLVIDLSS
jgi:hypothetical protein